MNTGFVWAIALLIAYLLGSIPTGYWAGKLLKGIDIREHGSRSTGATNVLRTLGKAPAIVVLLVDIFKGVVAVAITRALFAQPGLEAQMPWAATLSALLAVVGHSKSIWLGFKGGKSAATGLGLLYALAWPVGLGATATFLITLGISRIVSLGSILTAIAAPILMLIFHQPLPYFLFGLLAGIYVLVTHRANIQRLLAGQEPRIGQKHQET